MPLVFGSPSHLQCCCCSKPRKQGQNNNGWYYRGCEGDWCPKVPLCLTLNCTRHRIPGKYPKTNTFFQYCNKCQEIRRREGRHRKREHHKDEKFLKRCSDCGSFTFHCKQQDSEGAPVSDRCTWCGKRS